MSEGLRFPPRRQHVQGRHDRSHHRIGMLGPSATRSPPTRLEGASHLAADQHQSKTPTLFNPDQWLSEKWLQRLPQRRGSCPRPSNHIPIRAGSHRLVTVVEHDPTLAADRVVLAAHFISALRPTPAPVARSGFRPASTANAAACQARGIPERRPATSIVEDSFTLNSIKASFPTDLLDFVPGTGDLVPDRWTTST